MATPHVTGVISLMFSVDPSLTPAQVLSILQSTARPFPSGSSCTTSICGSGIVDAAKAVAASFALTVSKTGNGSGTVASSPTGINCGSICSYPFGYDNPVTLTAIPSPQSIFTGWSGDGCSGTGTCNVTMSSSKSVTANFNLAPYQTYFPLVEH